MRIEPTQRNKLVPMAGDTSMGLSLLAGLFLILTGGFHILLSLGALTGDNQNVMVHTRYSFDMNVHAWGWVHLVTGIIAVIIGVGILTNKRWAYLLGVIVAALSAIMTFAFAPWSPFWAVLIIAFDILVIWALSREMQEPY
jgi:hypothetical protein